MKSRGILAEYSKSHSQFTKIEGNNCIGIYILGDKIITFRKRRTICTP